MKIRTPLEELRSLSLSSVCTSLWLDRSAAGTLPGCQPLVIAQLDHLLAALARLERHGPEPLTGLRCPGPGEHMLGAIAESVCVPDSLEAWPQQLPSAFPVLSALLDRLSAALAAGTYVDGPQLRDLCTSVGRAAVAARRALAS
jgi:hypothetical protein